LVLQKVFSGSIERTLEIALESGKNIILGARITKFIQIGFALFVFVISLGQTTLILKKK
jgi:hypothetical protein